MLTITWTYKRLTTEHSMFKDTTRGQEFQQIIDSLRDSSGLVLSHSVEMSPDELVFVSVYTYKNRENCDQFTRLILENIPQYFVERNQYIFDHTHRLIGFATHRIFRPPNVDFFTYDGNDLSDYVNIFRPENPST